MATQDEKEKAAAEKAAAEKAAAEKEAAEKVAAEKEAAEKAAKEAAEKNKGNKKDEEVSVPKKTLDAILSRLEAQDEYIEASKAREAKREKDIEMLKSVSDKARLARYEEQNAGPLVRTARVSFWEGSPIIAWAKGKDEVGFRNGRLEVNQTVKIYVDDGGEEPKLHEIEYLYWAQNTRSEEGEVVEKLERNGSNYWTIQMKDGRKITLDIRFINAF